MTSYWLDTSKAYGDVIYSFLTYVCMCVFGGVR